MMSWVPVAAGALLLAALLVDVFGTVFVPRGHAGIVSRRVYRWTWRLWLRASGIAGRQRRRLLALGGPLLLPLTLVLWMVELVIGFALIYLPWSSQLVLPSGEAASGWVPSLYVSAYAATTLGVGDIFPGTAALRLLAVTEAALGFALFTVSITYLLSVYSAVRQATSLALEISRFMCRAAGTARGQPTWSRVRPAAVTRRS
jgi:hypothetical protein